MGDDAAPTTSATTATEKSVSVPEIRWYSSPMRGCGALVVALFSGCGMSDGAASTGGGSDGDTPSAFHYSAVVDWQAPTIQSVTVDGQVVSPGFSLAHTFSSFDASAGSIDDVAVASSVGSFALQLVPSSCGGGASNQTCDLPGRPACADLTIENETWTVRDQSTPAKPYFVFYPDHGHCEFLDGTSLTWGE